MYSFMDARLFQYTLLKDLLVTEMFCSNASSEPLVDSISYCNYILVLSPKPMGEAPIFCTWITCRLTNSFEEKGVYKIELRVEYMNSRRLPVSINCHQSVI